MRPFIALGLGLILACNKPSSTDTSAAGSETPAASAVPPSATPSPFPNAPAAPADVAAPPADATKTPSGLASKVITPGTGKDHPGPTDKVTVHYTGWTKAGKVFDSSVGKPPIEFGLNEVVPGWTEGVQLMVIGEKRRLWVPAALAYGETARGGAPAGDLVFDVELLNIKPGPKPPAVPADVKAAPADAQKTKSGLAYKVLTKGKGTKHPAATDQVTVHYSGWTTDGRMFDSSVMRGEPASFGLNHVIPGWTEGVQLMVEGEKTRFWIPSDLAYGDKPKRPGAPAGPLVFDIELISIK
jgi:peptidylprolyl isomerase